MNFEQMTVTELRQYAKEHGVKGCSAMKKQELIDLFGSMEKKTEPAAKSPAKTKTAGAANEAAADSIPLTENVAAKSAAPIETSSESRPAAQSVSRPEAARPEMTRPAMQAPVQRPGYAAPARPQGYQPAGSRPQGYANPAGRPAAPAPGQAGRPIKPSTMQGRPARPAYNPQQGSSMRITYNNARTENDGYDRPDYQNSPRQEAGVQENQYQAAQTAPRYDNGPGSVVPPFSGTADGITPEVAALDSGETKTGILEIMPDGFGFIRCDNFLPGDGDVYVSPAQVRKFNLKTGDIVVGNTKIKTMSEKFSALLYLTTVNGFSPAEAQRRPKFENLTPIFPNERLRLETPGCATAMRIVDILSPIGKGQRGMIVSQPKAGKTTLLKQIASSLTKNNPELHIIILLIDERPEEVTDMKESIEGKNVEVIYSTFDELPENHKRVSEMVIERAKRLVEHKKDVVILLDSITRLARAYNLTCTPSGRTLSGGLDPAALHMPKKFFGAARNMREGGSITILATALVETGSRMDDVVFEEFKGTGNMELVLDRNLSERRIFPAIDLPKSGTRREDLLLNSDEQDVNMIIRRAFNSAKTDESVEKIISLFSRTKDNREFIETVKKTKLQ